MDHQATLETVVRHMFKQGVQSGDGDACFYRGPNGTSCAVGCLIPDDQYDPNMDSQVHATSIGAVYKRFKDLPFFKNLTTKDIKFLEKLQSVHDRDRNWDSSGAMKQGVLELFAEFDLSFMDELSFVDR